MVGDFEMEGSSQPIEGGFLFANQVERDYFRLLGQPLVAGGLWEEGQEDVCLINEALARAHFGDAASAVGRRLRSGPNTLEIVGVAGNTRASGPTSDPETPQIYFPYPADWTDLTLLFPRGELGDAALLAELRTRVALIEPDAFVEEVSGLDRLIADHLAEQRFVLTLLAAFSLLGLALATLGVLGLCNEWVRRHRRELGIRGALGATPRELARSVLGRGGRLTLLGLAAGGVALLLLTRVLSTQLFGEDRWDTPAVLLAMAIVLLTAIPALLLPARSAARVDPATVLREE